MDKTRTKTSPIKSRKRKKSNEPALPDSSTDHIMHPAKGSRIPGDELPASAPKIAKLVELVSGSKTSRASSIEDDLAGVNPLSTELADHDIGGLLDNVDFDSDTFDFQSQDGVSSHSIPGSVPDSMPDVHELLADEICFEEGFDAEAAEASKFSVRTFHLYFEDLVNMFLIFTVKFKIVEEMHCADRQSGSGYLRYSVDAPGRYS